MPGVVRPLSVQIVSRSPVTTSLASLRVAILKCAAMDALMDLPPPLFLDGLVATSGSARFSRPRGHQSLNNDVSSRL